MGGRQFFECEWGHGVIDLANAIILVFVLCSITKIVLTLAEVLEFSISQRGLDFFDDGLKRLTPCVEVVDSHDDVIHHDIGTTKRDSGHRLMPGATQLLFKQQLRV